MIKKILLICYILCLSAVYQCGQLADSERNDPVDLSGNSAITEMRITAAAVSENRQAAALISGGGLTAEVRVPLALGEDDNWAGSVFLPGNLDYSLQLEYELSDGTRFRTDSPLNFHLQGNNVLSVYCNPGSSSPDLTPVIQAVLFQSASGHAYLAPGESGTLTVVYRNADRFQWQAAAGSFVRSDLAVVTYRAPSSTGNFNASITVKNSRSGRQAVFYFCIRVVRTGRLNVEAEFAPEITDISASPGVIDGNHLSTRLTAQISAPLQNIQLGWETNCPAAMTNQGNSVQLLFSSLNGGREATCTVTASLRKGTSGFSASTLVLFLFPRITGQGGSR